MIAVFAFAVILALVTVFSVQNAMPVAITFFFWKFEASLAIVIFLSFLSGSVLTGLIILLRRLRRPHREEETNQSNEEGLQ